MSRPSVLLVEDSPELGVIVRTLGRRAGWEVVCRTDVPSGWAYLEKAVPSLLLLDIHLPGLDGLHLCRRARATPRLVSLPVALFTHWGLPGDIAAGLEAGADFLVCKDLAGRPCDLQARLAEILALSHGQPRKGSLGWRAVKGQVLESGWTVAVNRALSHPSLRCITAEVMRVVLGRAVQRAFAGAGTAVPAQVDLDRGVSPDGRSLAEENLPPTPSPEALADLLDSLTEQVWRLLGTTGSAPFEAALAAVSPGLPTRASRWADRQD
jgi:DNA-binding response OmpR family regulator